MLEGGSNLGTSFSPVLLLRNLTSITQKKVVKTFRLENLKSFQKSCLRRLID